MMPDAREQAARLAFAEQAEWCVRLASPLTAMLCDLFGRKLDRTTLVGRRVLDWPGEPGSAGDGLPLRLTGGLHALVRRGRLPALAQLYPPAALPEADLLWQALAEALADADAELAEWLDRTPQTNEVGRSAVLMSGLLVLAAQHDMPVALYELGASAGLNLMLDRYRYRFGTIEAGDPTSALILRPEWEGPPPPDGSVSVLRRRGVDLHPIDITRAEDRERLSAYVWPDQQTRVANLAAAIAITLADPPRIDSADAADWIEENLSIDPEPGVVRVITHTIAAQYFPAEVRRRIVAHIERVGAAATAHAPVAWLRYEIEPRHNNQPTLRLAVWPRGEEKILAHGHPHGKTIRWVA
jgi:hypothetical protein